MSLPVDPRELESIRQDLASRDGEVRRLAVDRLVTQPVGEALPRLLECLGDADWRVRKAAAERLVAAPADWSVVGPLIEALADGDNSGRRNAAAEALIRCGARAVTPLLEAAQSGDADVRKLVVDALGGIGDERAEAQLVLRLADEDPNVRAAAADALGGSEGAQAVDVLMGAAASPDEDRLVRLAALRALARRQIRVDPERLASAHEDPLLRPAVLTVLGCGRDARSLEPLLAGLRDTSRSVREAAMEAVLRRRSTLGPEAAASLVGHIRRAADGCPLLIDDALQRLASTDLSLRLVLVQFLGLLRREESVLPILESARDEAITEVALATLADLGATCERALERHWPGGDLELCRLACRVLARSNGECGQFLLLAALESPGAELRGDAARALGRRGCSAALPALVRRLEEAACLEEPGVEEELEAITDALLDLARPGLGAAGRAIALLTACLGAAPERVRRVVAAVLGRIGRPEDADVVTVLLKDASPAVRRAAVQALARLEPEGSSEPLRLALADESPGVRVAAALALGERGTPSVVDDLARLASDEDACVRAAAMRALGTHAASVGPAAAGKALELIERGAGDGGLVALAALEALDAIGAPAAARVAGQLLAHADAELVRAAVACIGVHGECEALEALLPLVSHTAWAVRAEAIQWLAERRVVRALPALLRRLETERDPFVRDVMLRALQRLEA